MAKATTCKDALKKWEEHNNKPVAEADDVNLCFQWPPINKMDNSLAAVVKCTKLSLSSNQIDKIAGVSSLKNLKILCLSRNQIRSLSGLESLGETLEELWISYNMIGQLKGIQAMKNLNVLYIAHNLIKDWSEVGRLQECPKLKELLFLGNPLVEHMDEIQGRTEIVKRLPKISKLDGEPVIRDV